MILFRLYDEQGQVVFRTFGQQFGNGWYLQEDFDDVEYERTFFRRYVPLTAYEYRLIDSRTGRVLGCLARAVEF